jgi:hypothetical protein
VAEASRRDALAAFERLTAQADGLVMRSMQAMVVKFKLPGLGDKFSSTGRYRRK